MQVESEQSDEESSEEEYKEGTAQKYISPIEVEDHLKKLWKLEHKLLGLMFGRFCHSESNQTET